MAISKIFSNVVFLLELFNRKDDFTLKMPVEWKVVRDMDLIDIDFSLLKIHRFQNSLDFLATSVIFEELIGEYQLGLKSLNYFIENQSVIPAECKNKMTLFLGTVCLDEENRLWVPQLYYLPFHEEWRTSFFCLSVDRVSSKRDVVLLAGYCNN